MGSRESDLQHSTSNYKFLTSLRTGSPVKFSKAEIAISPKAALGSLRSPIFSHALAREPVRKLISNPTPPTQIGVDYLKKRSMTLNFFSLCLYADGRFAHNRTKYASTSFSDRSKNKLSSFQFHNLSIYFLINNILSSFFFFASRIYVSRF